MLTSWQLSQSINKYSTRHLITVVLLAYLVEGLIGWEIMNCCINNLRILMISMMIVSAYCLFVGENLVYPLFIQILCIIFQSNCQDDALVISRNIGIQIVILCIIYKGCQEECQKLKEFQGKDPESDKEPEEEKKIERKSAPEKHEHEKKPKGKKNKK